VASSLIARGSDVSSPNDDHSHRRLIKLGRQRRAGVRFRPWPPFPPIIAN